MSNEQKTVSVPRALAENAANYMEGSASAQVNIWCRDLRALLDAQHLVCSNGLLCQDSKCPECGGNGAYKPAAQHQGEPFRLTAVAELVDDGDGGLEPNWILEGGTAELFAGMTLLVADNAPDLCQEDGSAEVYTHPGSGEVDRLRAEVKRLEFKVSQADYNYDEDRAQFKRGCAYRRSPGSQRRADQ